MEKKCFETGLTLLEVLFSLLIAGMLAAGVFYLFVGQYQMVKHVLLRAN
jgi:prepilin-type N-terminal cleavage/methylation domain-containing protein